MRRLSSFLHPLPLCLLVADLHKPAELAALVIHGICCPMGKEPKLIVAKDPALILGVSFGRSFN